VPKTKIIEPKIIEKKLVGISNALYISLPLDWLRRFRLYSKGEVVDLVVCDKCIIVVDRSEDFNSKELKRDVDLAQASWDERADREIIDWLKKLPKSEQEEVKRNWEQYKRGLKAHVPKAGVVAVKKSDLDKVAGKTVEEIEKMNLRKEPKGEKNESDTAKTHR
jgi:hypothetical protein